MMVSFYSYKQDIGCTMAAVNVGILLCQRFSKKVLVVDWNLTNPKLSHRLEEIAKPPTVGLIDIFAEYETLVDSDLPITAERLPDCRSRVNQTSVSGLDYLPAYSSRGNQFSTVQGVSFDWSLFYTDYYGGAIIQHLREQWSQTYDIVLLISEKGFTTGAAICTRQLADLLLLMLDMDARGFDASLQVARSFNSPEVLKDGRERFLLPMPSRIGTAAEIQQLNQFRRRLRERFADFLPHDFDRDQYFSSLEVPFVPYYEFGNNLAVLDERGKPSTLSTAYLQLSQYLVRLLIKGR